MKPPIIHGRRKIQFYSLMVVALFLSLFAAKTFPESASELTSNGNLFVSFIDVGQGDATLIKTPDGETILIDGGETDAYQTHLLPFFQRERLEKVDTAVVTHYHNDHGGGICELIKNRGARRLILPDYEDSGNLKSELQNAAADSQIVVTYASAGDSIKTNCNDLSIDILHPSKGGFDGDNFQNNSSFVISVSYGVTKFLITGDIEARAESSLLDNPSLECDVLKVPHHGSFTSSSDAFLKSTNPTYAVISLGKENPYGHPHFEVLDRLDQEDIRVYRTDEDGDIIFEVSSNGIKSIKS